MEGPELKIDNDVEEDQKWSASKPKKKSGCLGFFVLMLLLVGGGVAGLHFTDNLQPLIEKVKVMIEGEEVEDLVPVPPVEEPVEIPVAPEVVIEKEPTPPVGTKPAMDPAEAAYRAKFRKPIPGTKLTLMLKSKKKLKGVVEHLDDKGIDIVMGNVTMHVGRTELSGYSRARCYEDDYVTYMTGLNKWRAVQERKRQAQLAKMKAKYLAMRTKQGKAPPVTASGSKPTTSKVNVQDMDFKKWMDDQGATELLEARKKRIQEYEASRRASGREY